MPELLALAAAVGLSFAVEAVRTALPLDPGNAIDLGFLQITGLGLILALVALQRRLG